jgi:hypothetical protein
MSSTRRQFFRDLLTAAALAYTPSVLRAPFLAEPEADLDLVAPGQGSCKGALVNGVKEEWLQAAREMETPHAHLVEDGKGFGYYEQAPTFEVWRRDLNRTVLRPRWVRCRYKMTHEIDLATGEVREMATGRVVA